MRLNSPRPRRFGEQSRDDIEPNGFDWTKMQAYITSGTPHHWFVATAPSVVSLRATLGATLSSPVITAKPTSSPTRDFTGRRGTQPTHFAERKTETQFDRMRTTFECSTAPYRKMLLYN